MRRFGPLLPAVLAATLASASLAVFLLVRHAGDDHTGPACTGCLSRCGAMAVAVDAKAAVFGYVPSRNRAVTSVSSRPRDPAGGLGPSDHSVVYQDDFVKQLNKRFGASGVPYFAMDNEPDAWAQTHTDVHPAEMSYADMLRNYLDYAGAVKDAAPRAQVLAPELCCWTSLGYSALDRGTDNFRSHADRSAHQDVPFLLWWLRQVAAADKAAGRRTLDLLSVHFYPQAEGVYSDA